MSALLTGSSGGGSGTGLLESLVPMAATALGFKGTVWPVTGTLPFINWAEKKGLVTPGTIAAVVPEFPGIFGGYPFPSNQSTEIGPAGLFLALFSIIALAHLFVWANNVRRGHNFHISLGVAFFCVLKVVGYACRIVWAKNITRINVAICSVVFTQVAQLILLTMNLILAHRVFTWRHPETGNSIIVNMAINLVYFFVLAIIVMAIVGQSLPYVQFMTEHRYNICRNVTKAAAVFNLFYATYPFQLLALAFALPPGWIIPKLFKRGESMQHGELPPVFQASWIRSSGILYYPAKGSQLYLYKGEPSAKAERIMPSRDPPGNGEHKILGEPMHPDSPRMSVAVTIVIISSFTFLLNTCFRVAAAFRGDSYGTLRPDNSIDVAFWPWHPYVAYIFYGATEVAMITMYLVMRIDLRFYIPDMPIRAGKSPRNGVPVEYPLGHGALAGGNDGGSLGSEGKPTDTMAEKDSV